MKQILAIPSQMGLILRSVRKSAQLNQAELAKRIGVSQSRLSAMELDPGSISLDQLLALSSVLGLELMVQTKPSASSSIMNGVEW